MKSKNRYIAILEYASKAQEEDKYVDLHQLTKYLRVSGFGVDNQYKYEQLQHYCKDIFGNSLSGVRDDKATEENGGILVLKNKLHKTYTHLYMTPDACLKYTEYIELKMAHKAARQAKFFSWFAIFLSLASLGVAAFWIQTIRIDEQQFNRIIYERVKE